MPFRVVRYWLVAFLFNRYQSKVCCKDTFTLEINPVGENVLPLKQKCLLNLYPLWKKEIFITPPKGTVCLPNNTCLKEAIVVKVGADIAPMALTPKKGFNTA